MRETFKSLSIFSAMLLVLLLISSGCVVNIPGCGKRTLPFFKKTSDSHPTLSSALPHPIHQLPINIDNINRPVSPASVSTKTAKPSKSPAEIEISMAPKATPTQRPLPTATPTPQAVEEFAYTLLQSGKNALWTMNTDGSNSTQVSPRGTQNWFPLWSPNGKLLAFLSNQTNGKINLFVIKKGETKARQITFYDDLTLPSPNTLKAPFSWSPRSDQIAYIYHKQIWLTDLNNLSTGSLFTPSDPSFSISDIDWAPYRDNKSIAFFVKKGPQSFALWLVNPRLLDKLKLAEIPYEAADLSWSSDARQVAYSFQSKNIYTASPETSAPDPVILNASPQLGGLLRYSPSETGTDSLLVLAKKDLSDKNYRVAVIAQKSKGANDSGTLTYLTDPGVTNALWSPDGKKIAYLLSGNLWVMNADGSHKTEISIAGVQSPDWSRK